MAQQRKKLIGWWKNIPFIVLPMALFMSFAYLETSRLHFQYKETDIRSYIQELEKDIANLNGQEQDGTRIGKMEDQSSEHGLHPPEPDQVVTFERIDIDSAYAKVMAYQTHSIKASLPTRTVLLHVDYEELEPQNDLRGPFSGGVAYGQEESN